MHLSRLAGIKHANAPRCIKCCCRLAGSKHAHLLRLGCAQRGSSRLWMRLWPCRCSLGVCADRAGRSLPQHLQHLTPAAWLCVRCYTAGKPGLLPVLVTNVAFASIRSSVSDLLYAAAKLQQKQPIRIVQLLQGWASASAENGGERCYGAVSVCSESLFLSRLCVGLYLHVD